MPDFVNYLGKNAEKFICYGRKLLHFYIIARY